MEACIVCNELEVNIYYIDQKFIVVDQVKKVVINACNDYTDLFYLLNINFHSIENYYEIDVISFVEDMLNMTFKNKSFSKTYRSKYIYDKSLEAVNQEDQGGWLDE